MEFQALSKYEVTETKYELWQTDLMMMTYLMQYHDDDAPDLHFYQTARKQKKTQAEAKSKTSAGVPILLRSTMGRVVNITTSWSAIE